MSTPPALYMEYDPLYLFFICTETYNYATADYHSFSHSVIQSFSQSSHAGQFTSMRFNSIRAHASFSTTANMDTPTHLLTFSSRHVLHWRQDLTIVVWSPRRFLLPYSWPY